MMQPPNILIHIIFLGLFNYPMTLRVAEVEVAKKIRVYKMYVNIPPVILMQNKLVYNNFSLFEGNFFILVHLLSFLN